MRGCASINLQGRHPKIVRIRDVLGRLLRLPRIARIVPLLPALALTAPAADPGPPKPQVEFFETKIRPILSANCYKCHSVEQGKSKGGLTLDSRDGWMRGGEDGQVIVPGDPVKSVLIKAVSYADKDLQMPPKDKKLADEDIATLTAWVKMGAPDPRTGPVTSKLTGLTDKARAHWAYQPVRPPVEPVVKNSAWCLTPVDHFILAKLEARNMLPSPQANRETLIRRAYYDLIGLPPSPAEIQAFVTDPALNAFAKVVDSLLASPHYGERWGRHWLDTARYADTKGDMGIAQRDMDYRYPYAWTYRDYVIDSLNRDKPYNQFIIEQIAADRLPESQQDKSRLAALGFLTVGQRFQNVNDIINDRIDVVSKGFLGITVSCARCHDHKFDPIPTTDYYALHGVFASTVEPPDKPVIRVSDPVQFAEFQQKLRFLEDEDRSIYYNSISSFLEEFHSKPGPYLIAATKRRKFGSAEMVKAFAQEMQANHLDPIFMSVLQQKIRRNDPVFAPLRMFADIPEADFAAQVPRISAMIATGSNRLIALNPLVVSAFTAQPVPASLDDVLAIYTTLFTNVESHTKPYLDACAASLTGPVQGFDAPTVALIQAPFDILPASQVTTPALHQLAAGLPQLFTNKIRFNFPKINELELTHPGAPARAMVVADAPKPQDSRLFIRGQAETKGDVVPRHFLEILTPGGKPQPFHDGSGRLELARAIATPENPLTARVLVNRVWMHHFGEGFVRTPDNLGTQSEPPSHPELLDYLANYFVQNGWSLKKLHRLIMLSRVYQEGSETTPAYEQADPENRLLWRANIRRLDFESLRDTLLAFSGKLDRSIGGKPVNLTDEPYSYRRSVYGYIDRGHMPELMSLFDFSDPNMPNSRRSSTIVPQQALFLMNSPMSVEVSRDIVARPEFTTAANDTQRILQLYRIIFQRAPRPVEIQLGLQFMVQEEAAQTRIDGAARPAAFDQRTAALQARLIDKKNNSRKDALRPIENEGVPVARKPLNPWETYTQALLFSNEASYIN
jgi:mono/diheme cytochrome c family protein